MSDSLNSNFSEDNGVFFSTELEFNEKLFKKSQISYYSNNSDSKSNQFSLPWKIKKKKTQTGLKRKLDKKKTFIQIQKVQSTLHNAITWQGYQEFSKIGGIFYGVCEKASEFVREMTHMC